VEVVLNGTHLGNYYLCEQIKVDKNRVNVAELKETDTEEPAISGGYLVELDTYYDEINKFRSIHKNLPVNFKEPDEDVLNSQQMDWFKDYFNQVEDILYGSGEGSYQDYIDVNSFIDWWLVYELALNGEPNHPKSSYMYKDRNEKLKAGPVWDFDWGTFIPNLLVHLAGITQFDIFRDKDFKFMGALTENFVAQTLVARNRKLYYWASGNQAEVDFLLSYEKGIVPCEVKAAENVKSKSLSVYVATYKPEYAIRVSARNFGFENNIKSVPLYAAFCI